MGAHQHFADIYHALERGYLRPGSDGDAATSDLPGGMYQSEIYVAQGARTLPPVNDVPLGKRIVVNEDGISVLVTDQDAQTIALIANNEVAECILCANAGGKKWLGRLYKQGVTS